MLVFECSCYRKVIASTFVEPALMPHMSQFYYITPLSTEYSMTNGKINNAYYIQYSNTTTFSGFPPPQEFSFLELSLNHDQLRFTFPCFFATFVCFF